MESTCKSGSARVTITPMSRLITTMGSRLLDLEICPPMPSPKGLMDISDPSWNIPMPTISRMAPTTNMTTEPVSSGTRKMLSSRTIPVIGSTAESDSSIFSFSFGFKIGPLLFHWFLTPKRENIALIQRAVRSPSARRSAAHGPSVFPALPPGRRPPDKGWD